MNVRKRLMKTMKDLLDHDAIENISVNRIVQESDISKTTFYRYYPDKYGLMADYYLYSMEEILANDAGDFVYMMKKLMEFIRKNDTYFRQFVMVDGADDFYHSFMKFSLPNSRKFMEKVKGDLLTEEEAGMLSFYLGGVWVYLQRWILDGCSADIDQAVEVIYACMPKKLQLYSPLK